MTKHKQNLIILFLKQNSIKYNDIIFTNVCIQCTLRARDTGRANLGAEDATSHRARERS